MSRIDDENWTTLEELLEEYNHPEHGENPIDMPTLTDKLRKMIERGALEVAWDDEINEPIFRLTAELYAKYRA